MSSNNKPFAQRVDDFLKWLKGISSGIIITFVVVYLGILIVLWCSIASINPHGFWKALASITVVGILFYTPFLALKIFTALKKPVQNQPGNNSSKSWYEKDVFKGLRYLLFACIFLLIFSLFGKYGDGVIPALWQGLTDKDPEVAKAELNAPPAPEPVNKSDSISLVKYLEKQETERLKLELKHQREMEALRIREEQMKLQDGQNQNSNTRPEEYGYDKEAEYRRRMDQKLKDMGPLITAP